MARLYPLTTTSDFASVTASAVAIGGGPSASALLVNQTYVLASTTNCWVRQGSCILVTCVTKANFADTDYFTITLNGTATVYEFDTSGNGVTTGRTRVNISAATTAASVAVILRVAILAAQTTLEVTDNSDGTLTIAAPDQIMSITENVANAGFLVANAVMTVSAADGSLFLPAATQVLLHGDHGPQVALVRNTADGSATLTRCKVF